MPEGIISVEVQVFHLTVFKTEEQTFIFLNVNNTDKH